MARLCTRLLSAPQQTIWRDISGRCVRVALVFYLKHLCLLLSLVNNHARLLFYAYYLRIQLCLIHGHVLHGAPAFIQHKHSQLNYRTPSPKAHNRPPSASSCLLPRTTRHLQRSRGFARCPNALLLLVLFCPVLFSGCWFLLEIIKQRY